MKKMLVSFNEYAVAIAILFLFSNFVFSQSIIQEISKKFKIFITRVEDLSSHYEIGGSRDIDKNSSKQVKVLLLSKDPKVVLTGVKVFRILDGQKQLIISKNKLKGNKIMILIPPGNYKINLKASKRLGNLVENIDISYPLTLY